MDDEEAVALIVQTLAVDLGTTMAKASVEGVASRLGMKRPLRRPDLERLLGELAPGLTVFLGRDRAASTIDAIRVRLKTGSAT